MKKRIAYIAANINTLYEANIISIMSSQACSMGYDLIVLTHFVNYFSSGNYVKGDENIYSLIDHFRLDGAILSYNTFFSKELADSIEKRLANKKIPVIAFDYKSRSFESCMQNDREGFRRITEHFIKVHGLTDIICLSGPKDNIHSKERVSGYKDALKSSGITPNKDRIIYGDFWLDSPKELAADIISGKIKKPQAVICGNDYTALQLCISLSEGGIKIPEEIAVGGFDWNPDTLKYRLSVTTYGDEYLKNAVNAVCRIHEMISGRPAEKKTEIHPGIRIGESCGCKSDFLSKVHNCHTAFDIAFNTDMYLHCSYASMLNSVKTLQELSMVICQNMYLFAQDSGFSMCLCSDWDGDMNDPENYRSDGYSENMNCIFSYIDNVPDGSIREFRLENILPGIEDRPPMTYICTPLHHLDKCFGYCVRNYKGNITFEKYYGEFCQIASNAIEKIRMMQYEDRLNEKIRKLSERDITTGLYSRKGLISQLQKLSREQQYYGILFYIGSGTNISEEIIAAFAQAVNLSCISGETAARTSSNKFVIISKCDGSEHPEQLFINILRSNIKIFEARLGKQILSDTVHFVSKNESSSDNVTLLRELEEKLDTYKNTGSVNSTAFSSVIRKLHYDIYESPEIERSAETESESIGISQSYFQHLYRKYIGISFKADMISARMALAESLLKNSAMNVNEIAEKCGYSDHSYFMKTFRKTKGMTASAYRKQYKN